MTSPIPHKPELLNSLIYQLVSQESLSEIQQEGNTPCVKITKSDIAKAGSGGYKVYMGRSTSPLPKDEEGNGTKIVNPSEFVSRRQCAVKLRADEDGVTRATLENAEPKNPTYYFREMSGHKMDSNETLDLHSGDMFYYGDGVFTPAYIYLENSEGDTLLIALPRTPGMEELVKQLQSDERLLKDFTNHAVQVVDNFIINSIPESQK